MWSEQDSRTVVGRRPRTPGNEIGAAGFDFLGDHREPMVAEKITEPGCDRSLATLVRTRIAVRVDGRDADKLLKKVRDGIHPAVESQDAVNVRRFP